VTQVFSWKILRRKKQLEQDFLTKEKDNGNLTVQDVPDLLHLFLCNASHLCLQVV